MKLRFSIRDLLWLILVVGMAVAWWIDHQRLSEPYRVLRIDGKYEMNVFRESGFEVLRDTTNGKMWILKGENWTEAPRLD